MQAIPAGPALDRGEVAARLWQLCRTSADPDADLEALAASVAGGVSGSEDGLDIRAQTAVRLLERGERRLAAEVVRHDLDRHPFHTLVRSGRVHVWLPGFDDPRSRVPDEVYDISDRIVLRRGLDEVRWEGDRLVVGGYAHLSHLVAEPEDQVHLVLRSHSGAVVARVPAQRVRRPDRVGTDGAQLTRLAWSGFCAEVDVRTLAGEVWKADVEVEQRGVSRSAHLSPAAGSGVAALRPFELPGPGDLDVGVTAGGRLVVEPRRRLPVARLRAVAGRARRLAGRAWARR